MEVNKLSLDVSELDVNNDGKITAEDKLATDDTKIQQKIDAYLTFFEEQDDDTELDIVATQSTGAGASTGASTDTSTDATLKYLNDQVSYYQNQITTLQSEINVLIRRKGSLEEDLKRKENEIEEKQLEYNKLAQEIADAENPTDEQKTKLATFGEELTGLRIMADEISSTIKPIADKIAEKQTYLTASQSQLKLAQDALAFYKAQEKQSDTTPVEDTPVKDDSSTEEDTGLQLKDISEYIAKIQNTQAAIDAQYGKKQANNYFYKNEISEFLDISGDGIVNAVDYTLYSLVQQSYQLGYKNQAPVNALSTNAKSAIMKDLKANGNDADKEISYDDAKVIAEYFENIDDGITDFNKKNRLRVIEKNVGLQIIQTLSDDTTAEQIEELCTIFNIKGAVKNRAIAAANAKNAFNQ